MFYYHIQDPIVDWDPDTDEDDESIEEKILRKLRMSGLVDSELEVIRHMDREIEKESQVIPVAMKDGLIVEAKSSVASRQRFKALKHVRPQVSRVIGLTGTPSPNGLLDL